MTIMEDNNKINIINTKDIEIPVIFYDGEREIDLGKVEITHTMTFKLLQSTLSNKIGISPNHITIYFDRSGINNANVHHHHRRRHPVTSKFDFKCLEVGVSFFWVVLKRGRRNRQRRSKNNVLDAPAPFVLLRRGVDGYNNHNYNYLEYLNQVRMVEEIEREKERFLMSLNLNSNVYNELSGYGLNHHHQHHYTNYGSNYSDDYYYGRSVLSDEFDFDVCSSSTGGASSSNERVFCDVCCGGGGETVPFHCCKNDVVVPHWTKTRSGVGPIAPPAKNGLIV